MIDLYKDIDLKRTQNNAKAFLKEYRTWKLEYSRFHSWLAAGTVKTTDELKQKNNIEAARADFECALRIKTLEQLAQVDDHCCFLSDLLFFRYINNWTVVKVCSKLAEKYELDYIAERTYTNYLHEALWSFAVICPHDLMAKK